MYLFFLAIIGIGILLGLKQRFIKKFKEKIKQKTKKTTSNSKPRKTSLNKNYKIYGTFSLAKIDNMSGTNFEEFIEKIFRVLYKGSILRTELTQKSGDQGCDIVVKFNEGTVLGIQCKRYSDKVDNKAVQNIVSAKAIYGLTKLMVITNSYFTPAAIEAAKFNRVELVDRGKLKKMIDKYNKLITDSHK